MAQVKIKRGHHRGHQIENETFTLVSPWKNGAGGAFVTVQVPDCGPHTRFKNPIVRIKCNKDDLEYQGVSSEELLNEDAESLPQENYTFKETDEQTLSRLNRVFELVNELSKAAAEGAIRGLIISGPSGIGKSHEVVEALQDYYEADQLLERDYKIIKGSGTPISLYMELFNYSGPGQTLVLDDADRFLWEEESLNLLKAVLDTSPVRRVSWLSQSRVLDEADIPRSFTFEGSVIFLTNLKFDSARNNSKIADHLRAILGRCHYLDLEVNDTREILLRIRQVIDNGMLRRYGLTRNAELEVIDFIYNNYQNIRHLDLRTVNKIAELRKSSQDLNNQKWIEHTVNTCFTRDARFRWLAQQLEISKEIDKFEKLDDYTTELDVVE